MFIPRHETGEISSGAKYALASLEKNNGQTDAQRDELTQARLRRKRRHARRQLITTSIKSGWS